MLLLLYYKKGPRPWALSLGLDGSLLEEALDLEQVQRPEPGKTMDRGAAVQRVISHHSGPSFLLLIQDPVGLIRD